MNPIIPIAIGGAAVTALVLALKGKGKQIPDPPGLPKIYMKGAAGARQFEMRRVGPGYAWTVSGEKEGAGSDSNSGNALMSMFEFLYTGNNADKVTGSIAKGSDEGMAGSFSIVREEALRWSWIISKPAPDQQSALGSGENVNRGAATIEMLATIEPFTDWITNLPSLQGGGGPDPLDGDDGEGAELDPDIDDGGDVPIDPTLMNHGLVITPESVAVANLEAWLAYAAPIVADGIQQDHTAEQIHTALGLDELDADKMKFSGKTHGQVLNTMLAYINQWDQQKFLELDNVQRTVAAAAVGVKIPTVGKKGLVKGKPVVVVRQPNGVHVWRVWPVGNRRGDQFAMFTGSEYRLMPAWNEAAKAAAGPGTVPGGGAPIQSCDEPSKTSSPSSSLTAATFLESKTKKIQIWTPGSADCHRYRLMIGVCLRPDGGGSFGGLDHYVDGLSQGDQPKEDAVLHNDYGIDRHPAYDAAMDWWRFEAPLAWKRQYQVDVSYVDGQIEVIEAGQINLPQIDPCPNVTSRWPGYGDDHYVVRTWKAAPRQHEHDTINWTSQPILQLSTTGKNLFMTVDYTGLPFLKAGDLEYTPQGEPMRLMGADRSKKTSYTVAFKIQSFAYTG